MKNWNYVNASLSFALYVFYYLVKSTVELIMQLFALDACCICIPLDAHVQFKWGFYRWSNATIRDLFVARGNLKRVIFFLFFPQQQTLKKKK